MTQQPVLIDGDWRSSSGSLTFTTANPRTGDELPETFPVSNWQDCDDALVAASKAAAALRTMPASTIAEFLETYADRIEARSEALVEAAHWETALPVKPRLADVELPRTTNQLRQAAAAARSGDWREATIDTQSGIRSCLGPLGPVCVFGPNNFPFAFGSISGGDFAAAIAAGNPVIAKGNSSHPRTTQLFAEEAEQARRDCDLPTGTVQLLYRTSHSDGERLVGDPRVGATGYTGSRSAGLKLKRAADAAGKPIYLELSSINPTVMLPGALQQRGAELAAEYAGSCLMGCGQFCTNPGLVLLFAGDATESFISDVVERFRNAPVGTLLSSSVQQGLVSAIADLRKAGADLLVGGEAGGGEGCSVQNTVLRVSADRFLAAPESFQVEAFGNAAVFVVAADVEAMVRVTETLEGNLTGSVYSSTDGGDEALYARVEPPLRARVGRLLNDKMPTGVAVSPAMNHGGPFPATGHPGFTAVGIPASLKRFGMLQCYDNVRPERLPEILQDAPTGAWRRIDGRWTQGLD